MRIGLTGQHSALGAVTRTGLASLGLLAAVALSACTTVEGTNALTDFGTFEREVMTSTLRGVGIINSPQKEEESGNRGPLVVPPTMASLPVPQEATNTLPADSDNVQIDTASLTEEDLRRLRNARVVDLRTMGGRPLTDAEAAQLTSRMRANNIAVSQSAARPLYLPPDEYFTTVGGQDLVCLAASGELVPLTDPTCPPEIRAALSQ